MQLRGIEVANRTEADQLRKGLADPMVRTFVRLIAIIGKLKGDPARERVLRFAQDALAEEQEEGRGSL